MSAEVAGRSDDDGKEGCEFRKKRKRVAEAERSLRRTGFFFVAVGLAVLFTQPEHGSGVATMLCSFGCLMINTKLAEKLVGLGGGGE